MPKATRYLASLFRAISGESIPVAASLVVTERCSRSCLYCETNRQDPEHPETGELLQVIDRLAEAGTLNLMLTGGEPMLRKDIAQIIAHAISLRMDVRLNTNGHQIPDRIEELRGLQKLTVSLDGPESFHDGLRGKGAFKEAVAAIEAAKASGIPVEATAVVSPGSKAILDDLFQLVSSLGVQVAFQPIFSQPGNDECMRLSSEERKDFFAEVLRRKKKRAPIANIKSTLRYFAGEAAMPLCWGGRAFCRIEPSWWVMICGDFRGCKVSWDPAAPLEQALSGCDTSGCRECNCASHVAINSALGFRPSAIWDILRKI